MPDKPSGGEHRQTVEAIFAAFTRGDTAAVLDCYADDVEYESWPADGLGVNFAQASGVPWLQTRHGKDEVREHLTSLSELEISNFQIIGFLEGDKKVMVEVVIDATWRPTSVSFRDEEVQFFEFNDAGKIIKTRHYLDSAKHMNACGLDATAVPAASRGAGTTS